MDEKLGQIADLLAEHGVQFALLFGSHAKGEARPGSDIDVGYWANDDVDEWDLRGALPDDVDLVDLRRAPEYLAGRIAAEGKVIVDADPPLRVRWQAETRKRYFDEEPRRRQYAADFAKFHG